jgi:hypothetical protein
MREQPPGTPGARLVQERVDDFPQLHDRRVARARRPLEQGLQHSPLLVREVGGIGLPRALLYHPGLAPSILLSEGALCYHTPPGFP